MEFSIVMAQHYQQTESPKRDSSVMASDFWPVGAFVSPLAAYPVTLCSGDHYETT